MERVKPVTLGIIALLLILLCFNFIPKEKEIPTQENIKTQVQQPILYESQESNATLEQSNVELIQKNIEFLRENIKILQEESKENNTTQTYEQISEESSLPIDSTEEKVESATPYLTQDIEVATPVQCVRNKPQLAIIIDDVGHFAQYQAISKIPYKITPSLFPKSALNKDTPKIAKIAPFFMVHLPLEALNFYQKGHRWLRVGDSKETIEDYIATIKQDFPNLTYLNNHTGSKFTKDAHSMTLLLETLFQYKINFLDSKTIQNTYTSTFYANHKEALLNPCQKVPLMRDIFLDNELEIPKITQNLIQAVKIAKTQGYAIAIAHPHKETLLALKNAEDYLKASGVELVYVHEIIAP